MTTFFTSRNGKKTSVPAVIGKGDKELVASSAPDKGTDWVLILLAK